MTTKHLSDAPPASSTRTYSNILKNTRISLKKKNTVKTSFQLERHLKGVANHHRISILFLVAKREGISLDEIVTVLDANTKTISEHTRRLVHAGLVEKKYKATWVIHSLTPYGKIFYEFLRTF